MKFRTKPLATLVSGLFVGALCLSGAAHAAKPQVAAQDTGTTDPSQTHTVSLIMQLRNVDQLNKFIQETVNPESRQYHQFLSVEEFAHHYGPTEADIKRVKDALAQAGIHVDEVYRSRMVIRATGTTAQLNQFFATEVHNYKENEITYHKPLQGLTMPGSIADVTLTVTGLDTKPKAHSMTHSLSKAFGGAATGDTGTVALADKAGTINAPGQFTIADFAQLYHVQPLYDFGVAGQGSTIGIATLANFDPNDARAYWKSLGIKVAPNKIKEIQVDGGAGTNGADETTLDVEQSGGIAPASRVFVYEAPNTDQGFIDVFFKAAEENRVDTISVSWGQAEIAQTPEVMTGQHQAFMELAAQGISVFAASGDSGAYDINNNQGGYAFPGCSTLLSVDSPSNDPLVTAAGGLTLAGTQVHKYGNITIPATRPWAWDYLQNYIMTNYGEAVYYAFEFPVGGGGGVSVNFGLPSYQTKLKGVQASAPNQSLICQTTSGPQDLIDMPDGFAGRNLPDVSLNADPETGYAVYFSGGWQYGFGGTSFVAPQLNGITALIAQVSGTRLGFMNPQLYSRFRHYGYGKHSPFVAITSGDNEYWQATKSYNPASGLGALDVEKLALSFLDSDD